MRHLVGWRSAPRTDTVELRHARDYAAAVGIHAADLRPGAPVIPTMVASYLNEPPQVPDIENFGRHWLNGTDRFTVHDVLRVGDQVDSVATLTAADLKQGRSGPLGLLTFVTEFAVPGRGVAVVHTGTRLRR